MKRSVLGVFCYLIVLWMHLGASVYSQDINKNNVVKKTLRIIAVDEKGDEIEGVSIKPFGLNMSYFWPEGLLGKPVVIKSDKNGLASVEYPFVFADGVQCKTVDCLVSHPNYVGSVSRIPVSEDEDQKIVLKRGVKFRVKAIDEDGSAVKERFAVMMSGEASPESWLRTDGGWLESNSAGMGGHQVMLVQPVPGKKSKFSESLFFFFTDKDQELGVEADDVELVEGIRVYGKMPDYVKRPVKNGIVMATQKTMPIKNANELNQPLLMWQDWTTIAEDGSFEFQSMPRSGEIQMIAMCDGWVSLCERGMVTGQTFPVPDQDLQVDLQMEATVDVSILVNDEKGNPVKDVDVGFSPNQLWKDYGSNILGARARSVDIAQHQMDQDGREVKYIDNFEAFSAKTDEAGKARILNLPAHSSIQFYAGKKGFDSREDNRNELENAFKNLETDANGRQSIQVTVVLKKSEAEPKK